MKRRWFFCVRLGKNGDLVKTLKPNWLILHSRKDDVIPFEECEELVFKSGLAAETLVEVGCIIGWPMWLRCR
jgi:hypothetical protein